VGRVNEPPAADVETDVVQSVEEDEIARVEPSASNPAPELELRERVVRQRDAEAAIHERHEPRAVEAASRRHAAVAVRDAEETAGVLGDADADLHLRLHRRPRRSRLRGETSEREQAENEYESEPQHVIARPACAAAHPAVACRRSNRVEHRRGLGTSPG